MMFERFRLYIEGGGSDFIDKTFTGCSEKTLPKSEDRRPIKIPYELYFYGKSAAWKDNAVAFISEKPQTASQTYCRIYRVTKLQFEQIVQQENGLDPETENLGINYAELEREKQTFIGHPDEFQRYGRVIWIGRQNDLPILTFTSKREMEQIPPDEYSEPSKEYLSVIIKGIKQSHKMKNSLPLFDYFKGIKGIFGCLSDNELMDIIESPNCREL